MMKKNRIKKINSNEKTDSLPKKRYPLLDSLRALAVLVVLFNHFWGNPKGGYLGVDIFFVISGFLITDILINKERKIETADG